MLLVLLLRALHAALCVSRGALPRAFLCRAPQISVLWLLLLRATPVAAQGYAHYVSVLAGEPGASGLVNGDQSVAKFNAPSAICGFYTIPETTLFVADTSNHCIRKLTISNERDDAYIAGSNVLVSVLTGLGVAGSTDGESGVAKLRLPQGVACANTAGATAMYVADTGNFCIRHVDMTNGNVTTVAGVCGASSAGFAEGTGTNAKFAGPLSAAFYKPGSSWTVFVADTGAAGGYRIRRATSALANSLTSC